MNDIRDVKLEFLRPGPAHNQLLSPLTPYVAVCGEDGSVTVNMPFEHRELLIRLRRLRYQTNLDPALDVQRQAEVRSIGEEIGKIIGQVPSLLSAISNIGSEMVHLRLVLSPSELGMLPFEMAIAPSAFPGSGSALFLQPCAPITVTREVRRSAPLKVDWQRRPRILFAFASPPGYARIPAQDHLDALRRAIEPWVDILDPGQHEARIEKVKQHLTVLPDASLEDIRQACAATAYTHVHILAHGAACEEAGDLRFGIALARPGDPSTADIVDGTRLAIALTAAGNDGSARPVPTFVSLATCDSGNIESVLTPGGSIAHALHMAGIPWVVASQFPLWMRASTMAAEILYGGILDGLDPRRVLFDLRQRLRANAPGTHDWASIVAYAQTPWGFDKQVQAFRYQQTKRKANIQLDRLEKLTAGALHTDALRAEMNQRHATVRGIIAGWIDEAESSPDAALASERLGMGGAMEKRIALNLLSLAPDDPKAIDTTYAASMDYYQRALFKATTNHWVATQYLSLAAVRKCADMPPPDAWKDLRPWWQAAEQLARWEYASKAHHCSGDPNARLWAIGTLLELLALGSVFLPADQWDVKLRTEEAGALAREMLRLIGDDRFPLESTSRQFKRYQENWPCPAWDRIVGVILDVLGDTYTIPADLVEPRAVASATAKRRKKTARKPI